MHWATLECKRQGSTQFDGMLLALDHAVYHDIDKSMIKMLAYLIEPWRNVNGYRTVPVTFNQGMPAIAPELIERQMNLIIENIDSMTTDEFCKAFLDIHPFADGNGRVASVLYNKLNGTLDDPIMLPYYYGEE
jgi:hypothetical protein